MAATVFWRKVLQDDYGAAPRDAGDAVKPVIRREVLAHQHFPKVAELWDTNETSTRVSQRLMIDKEWQSLSPTPPTPSFLHSATTAPCQISQHPVPTSSSPEIPSLMQSEAELDAGLTPASINIAAQSSLRKSLVLQENWETSISRDVP